MHGPLPTSTVTMRLRYRRPVGTAHPFVAVAFLVMALAGTAQRSLAQNPEAKKPRPPEVGREFGVSLVGNLPTEPAGVGFWGLLASGMGGYLDVKFGVPFRDGAPNFVGRFSAQYAEDRLGGTLVRDDPQWVSVNAGLARRFVPTLAGYVGGGLSMRLLYREYQDSLTADRFWIEDPAGDEYRPNVVGGVLWSVTSRLRLQLGAEMKPPGVVVGIGFVPSRRRQP